MNEHAQKWIDELRSTELDQTGSDWGDCARTACALTVGMIGVLGRERTEAAIKRCLEDQAPLLRALRDLRELTGMPMELEALVMEWNDEDDLSFEEIAEELERRL